MSLEQWSHTRPLAGSISARFLSYQLDDNTDFLSPLPRVFGRKANSSDRIRELEGVRKQSAAWPQGSDRAAASTVALPGPQLTRDRASHPIPGP